MTAYTSAKYGAPVSGRYAKDATVTDAGGDK